MVDTNIHITARDDVTPGFEIVERKGIGHPDTLSDELAERLSLRYSKYTKSNFGAILHHNFDKVGLLGGHSQVEFGNGELTAPLRVLLNGRASPVFGNEEIPVQELLVETTREFLSERFPMIDPEADLDIHYNVSTASSPGGVDNGEEGFRDRWFRPESLDDLKEEHELVSNDTSHGCSYAPLTSVEQATRAVEERLNSASFKRDNPWLGNDIKIMATTDGDGVRMTAAIPQIADEVPDLDAYDRNLRTAEDEIREVAQEIIDDGEVNVYTNTRDDYETGELYLTAIGSAIESGDEGLVGRGNRVNGLITPTRPMSIEGQCGKNPVYHVGRIYNVAARRVSRRVHDLTGANVETHLVSQTGRDLTRPWKTVVDLDEDGHDSEEIEDVILDELDQIPQITEDWLDGEVRMY